MAEPQDLAVPGVASALKGLRTRVGLREDRLLGTELALDTLTGLYSVRAQVNVGESPEWAIVRAVRPAAGRWRRLCVSSPSVLRLRLFANRVSDSELYADELGQRREALLRNWDRLHELESVAPVKRRRSACSG